METNRISSVLIEAVSRETGVNKEEISLDTPIRSLCTDSLEIVSLIQEIEEILGIAIDEPEKFPTLRHAVNYASSRS